MIKKSDKNQAYGVCKYCGQTVSLFLPEGKTADDYEPKELVEMATGRCACDLAMMESARTVQEEEAITQIKIVFDDMLRTADPEGVKALTAQQDLITNAIKLVCREVIESAHIRLDAHSSFVIGLKNNGNLRIRRTYKGTEEWIF